MFKYLPFADMIDMCFSYYVPFFVSSLILTGVNICEVESPCKNGALCIDRCPDYLCICTDPCFTGKNCDIRKETSFCYYMLL